MLKIIKKITYGILLSSVAILFLSVLTSIISANLNKPNIAENMTSIFFLSLISIIITLFTLLIESFAEAAIYDHYSDKITIGKVIKIKEITETYFIGSENKSRNNLWITIENYNPNRLKGFETVTRTILVEYKIFDFVLGETISLIHQPEGEPKLVRI